MTIKMSSKQMLGPKRLFNQCLNIYCGNACIATLVLLILISLINIEYTFASNNKTSEANVSDTQQDDSSRPSFLDTGDIELPEVTVPDSEMVPQKKNQPTQKVDIQNTPDNAATDVNQDAKPLDSKQTDDHHETKPIQDGAQQDTKEKQSGDAQELTYPKGFAPDNVSNITETPLLKKQKNSDANDNNVNKTSIVDTQHTQNATQKNFISNEAQILILPNDDVILGQLQHNTSLEHMNFSEYEKLFWKNYYKYIDTSKTAAIDRFIDDYYLYKNAYYIDNDRYDSMALHQAFKAIKSNDFYELSMILDAYEITYDRDNLNNTLLHAAARIGNYPITKLLLMKGVYIHSVNDNLLTPQMLAYKYNHSYVLYLLMKADMN